MTEKNKNKLRFKNLSEMNHHIVTEMCGSDMADRIAKKIDKLEKLRSKPAGLHLNGTMERFGTEESGRMMLVDEAINKFNFPPEDTEYNN